MSNSCPICRVPSVRHIYNVYDDRYGFPGEFKLAGCSSCGHRFLQENFTPELMRRLYTDFYPRSSFSLDKYKPCKEIKGFKTWLNGEFCSAFAWVPRNIRVLDIGCGFGESLGYHAARGCEVYGVEADENARRIAEKFGFSIHIGLFDPDIYNPDFFDYVTMDQVIEHVAAPLETLRGIAKVLKPGGTAILSTPNAKGWGAKLFGKKWINWHAPYHTQHFSRKSLAIVAQKAGLYIEKSKTITCSEWLLYQWIHLVTFPHKGVPSAFWSPKGRLSSGQRLSLRMLSLLHKTMINHLLTSLFDFMNIGDNYIVILRKPNDLYNSSHS